LAAGAQAVRRQGRIGAGGNHHVHLLGQVLQQKSEPFVDRPLGDEVVVVQDKDDSPGEGCDLVEQRCEDGRGGGRLGCLERLQSMLTETAMNRLQRGDQVRE